MIVKRLVEKFSNLVFENQKFSNSYLKVFAGSFAGGLFAPLDKDSLKSDLEKLLNKRISLTDYKEWKNINQSLLNNVSVTSWFEMDPNSISSSPGGGNNIWIITKNIKDLRDYYENPEYFEDLDIHQSTLLQGYGSITSLYLVRADLGDNFSLSEPEQESPEIAHNLFIVEALRKFYGAVPKEDIDQFLTENKEAINKLKSSFEQQPVVLGEGADGITFSIGSDLVLKIFTEEHSYNKAKEAQERLWKNPKAARTEAMIYDVGVLGQIYSFPLYYYIIQKMKPVFNNLTSDTEIIIDLIVNNVFKFIAENKKDIFYPLKQSFNKEPNLPKLNNTIKSISRALSLQILEYVGESDTKHVRQDVKNTFNINLRQNWVSRFVEEIIMKYLTSRTDLHIGNVGVTSDGYLRYFDPAHPSGITVKNK